MNEDIIVLLCPNCTTQRSEETKGLSLKILKIKKAESADDSVPHQGTIIVE